VFQLIQEIFLISSLLQKKKIKRRYDTVRRLEEGKIGQENIRYNWEA